MVDEGETNIREWAYGCMDREIKHTSHENIHPSDTHMLNTRAHTHTETLAHTQNQIHRDEKRETASLSLQGAISRMDRDHSRLQRK